MGQNYRKFTNTSTVRSFTPSFAPRYQLIYNPGDFDNAPPTCVVKSVAFRRSGGPSNATIQNLKIKLGCVDQTNFSGNAFFQNLTTVLDRPTYTIAEGGTSSVVYFDVDKVFMYQAGKSLVVEISYTSASANILMRYSNASKRINGSLASQTGSIDTDWLDFGFDPEFVTTISPPNDLCTNAKTLSLTNDCQPLTNTTVWADQTLPPAFCGGFPSSTANDVYYKFTASTASDSILVTGLGGFDPVVQLFSGPCGNLSPLLCSYTPGNAQPEKIAPGNLVPGQTYFVRVYGFNGIDGSFTICGRSANPAAPANDLCANAANLPVSTVCASVEGSTAGATQELAPIPCFGNTSSSANEVWYKFTAVNAFDSIAVTSGGFLNPVVELYSGSCGNLNTISCSDQPTNPLARERVFTGSLSPGQTYYLRVYGFNNSTGTFSLCAKTPPSNPPANDESCTAVALTSLAQCQPQLFSTVGATESLSPNSCQPGGLSSSAADVWFKFPYTFDPDTIIVEPIGDFDPVIETYSMFVNCVQIDQESCANAFGPGGTEKRSTLGIGGNNVYVRVYGFNGTVGSFNICLRKGDPAVLYDACENAKQLTLYTACSPQNATTGNTQQSTPTPGLASCKGNADDDVWYKFDPIGAMNLAIRLGCDPGFDGAFEIFRGDCNTLTQLACVNRVGAGVQEDTLLSFPNNDDIYFIRIYHAGTGSGTGGFSLCVSRANAPANDNCSGAVLLQSGTNQCSPVLTSSFGATQANAPINCNGRTSTAANEVWYRFVSTSTTMEIYIDAVGGMDPVLQLYTGTCGFLTDRGCKDDSLAGQGERLIVTNMSIGATYTFRVYSHAQTTSWGDFTICIRNATICNTTSGTASTNTTNSAANGRVVLNLSGQSAGASVQWQISSNGGGNYTNIGAANAVLPDTFTLQTATSQNYQYRAVVTAPGCISASTQPVSVFVRCATPLTNPVSASSGTYISVFTWNGSSNTSSPSWLNGGYENFTASPIALCKGQSYEMKITHQPEGSPRTRVVWADFNNDGDFADANELIVAPNTGSGTLSQMVQVPDNASANSVRLRVMVVDAGNATPSTTACFAGPYAAGEIEEYTLNLSNPVVANAGPDRIFCAVAAVLQGSAPGTGSGLWTVLSGPATVQNPTSATSVVQNLSLVPSFLEWKVTNGTCVSTDTVRLFREERPDVLPEDSTVCVGDTLDYASPTGFANILWYNGNAGPFQRFLVSGNYWVQVTTQNGCTFRDTIQIIFEPCVGVQPMQGMAQIRLVPNPVHDRFELSQVQAGSRYRILNAEGREVAHGMYPGDRNLKKLKPGLYMLELVATGTRLRFLKE